MHCGEGEATGLIVCQTGSEWGMEFKYRKGGRQGKEMKKRRTAEREKRRTVRLGLLCWTRSEWEMELSYRKGEI